MMEDEVEVVDLEGDEEEDENEEFRRMRPSTSTSRPSGARSSLMSASFWDKVGVGRFSEAASYTIMEETNTMPIESLQHQFTYYVQLMKSRYEVFAVISKWAEQVDVARDALRLTDMDLPDEVVKNLYQFLEKERRTWDLLMRLYFDRLEKSEEEMREDLLTQLTDIEKINEQPAVNLILGSNQELREINIILRWLEASYAEKTEPDLTSRFVSWEQTLETLKRDKALKKTSNENMVKHMDPDAILREKKELHIYDQEEEAKVNRGTYYYIRSGQFDKALAFLNESAHIAKAAGLNGGIYTEKVSWDSENMEQEQMETSEGEGDSQQNITTANATMTDHNENSSVVKYRVIGNLSRDMWKNIAYKICETKKQSKYERATLGALCGHRSSVLNVAVTWEDKLWAYLKCLNDIRIEEELRKRCTESYQAMPEEYWSQKLTVTECLERIEGEDESGNVVPQNYENIFHVVQKKVMLDDVDGLMEILREYVPHFLKDGTDHPVLIGQVSRFLTHFILALGIMGLPYDEQLMDLCSETYVGVLVGAKQLIYIPFYVNCMTESRQIPVILNQINPEVNVSEEDISTFIQTAATNGLNVLKIGVAVVQKLFSQQKDFKVDGLLWISETYRFVEDTNQVMLQLLRHVLIITRKYLILGNIPKVRELLRLINQDCFKQVMAVSEKYEDTLIREYVCYNSYMEGEDYLEMWTKAKSQKPRMEDTSGGSKGTLADRVLVEKKTRDFNILETKWKKAVTHYLKETVETFMKLLKFPNGWLLDCTDSDSENESNELAQLKCVRKIIIPKVVFLLIKLIQESNSQRKMRDFLYVLCEDHRQILTEFPPSSIARIFKAIEASTRVEASND